MSFECSNRDPMNKSVLSGRDATGRCPSVLTGPESSFACDRRSVSLNRPSRLRWLGAQVLGCAVLLSACGGGGGTSDPTQAPTGTDTPAPGPAPAAGGSATLTWVAPQTNADGSALTDLAGYRIYYGTGSGNYTESVTISDPTSTSYTVQNLPASTYYFVLRAFDKSNSESSPSAEVTKSIN